MQNQKFNGRVLLLFARLSVQHYFFAYRILPLILMLIACLCGKCAIIYVLCRSPNEHIEKKLLRTNNVYIMPNGRCFEINYIIFHHFFRDGEVQRLSSQYLLAALNLLLGTNSLVLWHLYV